MKDIYVKCCRCRNTHLHSARKESAPDKYGMRTLVCPRCGAREFYKQEEPQKTQPVTSGHECDGIVSGADRTTGGWIGQP